MKVWTGLVAALVLIAPTPPATAKTIMSPVCGDPSVRILIPVKLPSGGGTQHECCKKGCHHAANDRKRRSDGSVQDDGCC
jgi:hypothetical protein